MANESRHLSVFIDRPAADVYRFASDPANLPRWAAGVGRSVEQVDGQWFGEAPMGRVRIEFVPANEFGVLDHDVTLPSGETVYNPVRVIPDEGRSEVVFTLRRRAGVTEADLDQDAMAVLADLASLKQVLEQG